MRLNWSFVPLETSRVMLKIKYINDLISLFYSNKNLHSTRGDRNMMKVINISKSIHV